MHIISTEQDASFMHFVIFGVFFSIHREHTIDSDFFIKWDDDEENHGLITIDFRAILDNVFINGREFYEYEGSITSPGCMENVFWHIFKDPLRISEETYEKFQ